MAEFGKKDRRCQHLLDVAGGCDRIECSPLKPEPDGFASEV